MALLGALKGYKRAILGPICYVGREFGGVKAGDGVWGLALTPPGSKQPPSAGEQLGAVVLFEPGGVASGGVCSKAINQSKASKQKWHFIPRVRQSLGGKVCTRPPHM